MKQTLVRFVDMDRMGFSKKKGELICTKGVTTCIAFAIRGYMASEKELTPEEFSQGKLSKKIYFAGLYHWSGFKKDTLTTEEQEFQVNNALSAFFYRLRSDLKIKSERPLMITELHFIGGERKGYSTTDGFFTHQGTEQEVVILKRCIADTDFDEEYLVINHANIHYSNFLTGNQQSLSVLVSAAAIVYEYEDGPEASLELTDDEDDTDTPGFSM